MPKARKKETVKTDNQKKSGHLSQFEARATRDKAEKHLKYIKSIESEKRKDPNYKTYKLDGITVETANPDSPLLELARKSIELKNKLL